LVVRLKGGDRGAEYLLSGTNPYPILLCGGSERILRLVKGSLGTAMVLALLASGSYALTASNAFAGAIPKSGGGAQAISGFAVSNVHYELDATDSTKYRAVTFDLDGTAGDVRAKVLDSATTFSTCSITTGVSWRCPISNTIAESDSLTVIAVE
jgi:hypothetical protein